MTGTGVRGWQYRENVRNFNADGKEMPLASGFFRQSSDPVMRISNRGHFTRLYDVASGDDAQVSFSTFVEIDLID
tara:strand:- start:199 stop:423 length:225 start_codon:yes stop_codon:yes gene_type:complete